MCKRCKACSLRNTNDWIRESRLQDDTQRIENMLVERMNFHQLLKVFLSFPISDLDNILQPLNKVHQFLPTRFHFFFTLAIGQANLRNAAIDLEEFTTSLQTLLPRVKFLHPRQRGIAQIKSSDRSARSLETYQTSLRNYDPISSAFLDPILPCSQ
jgi:hypothetical protein